MAKKITERKYTSVQNIADYVTVLKNHGDKILYRYPVGRVYEQISYAQFTEYSLSLAAGFRELDLSGKKIGVIGETSPEWVATYIAALACGAVIVPLDKELDMEAIEGFLSSVGAEAIVYGKSFKGKFDAAMENHPTLKYFITMGDEECSEKMIRFSDLVTRGRASSEKEPFEIAVRNREDLAVMLFTSGTTGTSKCVMLSEKNVFSTVNAACQTVEFYPDDTIVSVLPLHHTYELICMLSGMNYGMEIGINDSLRRIMKNFEEYKPTGLILVPLFINTMYDRITKKIKDGGKEKLVNLMVKISNALRKVGIDLRRVFFKQVLDAFGGRLCKMISGGAPLNPEMMKRFDAFGVTIAEGYGITECSPLIAVNPYYNLKPGSVGPAVPSCTVRIDGDRKNDKGYTEGEIQVKGDNVMIGYYNNDAENEKAFTADGWYRTGDIGYRDEDGYIYITGRLKSVIVLENGKNVVPEEIEEYLEKIEEVGEVVVVGRKAEDGETVILTAIVYPNAEIYGETPDTEKAYGDIKAKVAALNRSLPPFKLIKAVEIRETPFEKTTSRKIKRHLVK